MGRFTENREIALRGVDEASFELPRGAVRIECKPQWEAVAEPPPSCERRVGVLLHYHINKAGVWGVNVRERSFPLQSFAILRRSI
jgi:hypothetical protein